MYHLTAPGRLLPLTPRLILKIDYADAGIWILKPPWFCQINQNDMGHDLSPKIYDEKVRQYCY